MPHHESLVDTVALTKENHMARPQHLLQEAQEPPARATLEDGERLLKQPHVSPRDTSTSKTNPALSHACCQAVPFQKMFPPPFAKPSKRRLKSQRVILMIPTVSWKAKDICLPRRGIVFDNSFVSVKSVSRGLSGSRSRSVAAGGSPQSTGGCRPAWRRCGRPGRRPASSRAGPDPVRQDSGTKAGCAHESTWGRRT